MYRKIFAVGDSHSRRCFEDHPLIADSRVLVGHNKMDGKTAYNLERHEKKLLRILEPLRDKELIFCFGEVDIRIHIKYKHEQTGVPVQELLENTAKRYTAYVSSLRQRGYKIHVFNVIPTGEYRGEAAEKWKRGLSYPFTATHGERTAYTEMLNTFYKSYCMRLSIPYIDIYRYLVDGDGRRKKDLVFDFAHLGNQCADLVIKYYDFAKEDGLKSDV